MRWMRSAALAAPAVWTLSQHGLAPAPFRVEALGVTHLEYRVVS